MTSLKKSGLLRTYYRDRLRGYRLGIKAKSVLLDGWPERFTFCLTGDAETNRLKSEANRRFRLHRLAETYITIGNAGVLLYPDEKPKVFAQTGFGGEAVTYPVFYSSREVKELGADATQIRSSRFAGVLLAPTGIFVTYNSGGALMKWRYNPNCGKNAPLEHSMPAASGPAVPCRAGTWTGIGGQHGSGLPGVPCQSIRDGVSRRVSGT